MTTYKRANRIVWVLTDQASLLICFIPAQSSGHFSHLSREETLDFLLFLIGKSVAAPNFLWLNDIQFFLDDFHRKLPSGGRMPVFSPRVAVLVLYFKGACCSVTQLGTMMKLAARWDLKE
jgi:hypothetical protein